MANLTKENFCDFVRRYWSENLSYEECDTILWNLTSFPFSPLEKIKNELVLQHAESGGNIELAMDAYDDYVRSELKRLREEENGL